MSNDKVLRLLDELEMAYCARNNAMQKADDLFAAIRDMQATPKQMARIAKAKANYETIVAEAESLDRVAWQALRALTLAKLNNADRIRAKTRNWHPQSHSQSSGDVYSYYQDVTSPEQTRMASFPTAASDDLVTCNDDEESSISPTDHSAMDNNDMESSTSLLRSFPTRESAPGLDVLVYELVY
jgi:hypothetical protein